MHRFIPIIVGIALLSGAADLSAQDAEREPYMSPLKQRMLWRAHWRKFARKFAEVDGEFYALPKYDRKFPNSRGVTVYDVLDAAKRTVRIDWGGSMYKPKTKTLPRAEAEAVAEVLPRLAVGEYGRIHAAKVDKVVGPSELILEDIELVDEEAIEREMEREAARYAAAQRIRRRDAEDAIEPRFAERLRLIEQQDEARRVKLRLKGVNTKGLEEGDRWPVVEKTDEPAKIAIVYAHDPPKEEEQDDDRRRSLFRSRSRREPLTALPVSAFEKGVTEDQFKRLLEARGMTEQQFIHLVVDEMRENGDTAEVRVVLRIQGKTEE